MTASEVRSVIRHARPVIGGGIGDDEILGNVLRSLTRLSVIAGGAASPLDVKRLFHKQAHS
jgi:hypothetical protein